MYIRVASYPPVPGSLVPMCVGGWVAVCDIHVYMCVGGWVGGWVGGGDMYVRMSAYLYMCGVVTLVPWESGLDTCDA